MVGDFDCDGATACAVGVRGLRMLGAKRVSHAVPNRILHGYGMTPGLVEELAALKPDLLVTVDHGIACHAGIAAAKARGWQVLVTDHHLPGATLPDADAIVDPNQHGDDFPSKALAGVGVMFYVLLALRAKRGLQCRTSRRCWTSLRSAPSPTWSRWTPTTARWWAPDCAACVPGRAAPGCAH